MNKNGVLPRVWWLWWALVTTLSWAVVMPLNFDYSQYHGYYYDASNLLFYFMPLILAALGQGILLRGRLKDVKSWIIATSFGYSLGMLFFMGIAGFMDMRNYDFGAFIIGGITGVVPARIQSSLLNELPKSRWWIPTATLSFSMSMFFLYPYFGDGVNIIGVLFGGVLVGAAFGIPTGILMQYLLENSETHTIPSGVLP